MYASDKREEAIFIRFPEAAKWPQAGFGEGECGEKLKINLKKPFFFFKTILFSDVFIQFERRLTIAKASDNLCDTGQFLLCFNPLPKEKAGHSYFASFRWQKNFLSSGMNFRKIS